ncbi:carboxymuconolactone decarboxylase family protein [Erythrobacter rubeus]|uniref:Carboxymuconolactone decarboxylase family protein n=1 Tax=Erythrobacter rubeus TaxID=2760803 RepID=A0ABR8KVU9_9SPHN|nr:carboxymuconolactone decarboxylase family protein [Erythrobacter rubeus]MBD2843328.1 carboxymuconolactone decarboxylase family protein [Erythrobacter rubeus]
MSTTPRVSSAIAGEPAHFGSVLAHHPQLAERFTHLYGKFWDSDVLSARLKEVARMRNARVTECGFCRNVRFDKAIGEGLNETIVDDITEGYETSDNLTDTEKAVLKFTDALIHDPELLTGDARAALTRHLSPAQIAELGLGVTLFLALAKALITMGLEPEHMGRTELPTPAPAQAPS